MFTCHDVVVSAVQVLVNLRQATFYVPQSDHSKTCCCTRFAMVLQRMRMKYKKIKMGGS